MQSQTAWWLAKCCQVLSAQLTIRVGFLMWNNFMRGNWAWRLSELVPLMNSDESGRAYTSLGTRQEGGGFGDVGLSICALPLRILVLGFQRTEFR